MDFSLLLIVVCQTAVQFLNLEKRFYLSLLLALSEETLLNENSAIRFDAVKHNIGFLMFARNQNLLSKIRL